MSTPSSFFFFLTSMILDFSRTTTRNLSFSSFSCCLSPSSPRRRQPREEDFLFILHVIAYDASPAFSASLFLHVFNTLHRRQLGLIKSTLLLLRETSVSLASLPRVRLYLPFSLMSLPSRGMACARALHLIREKKKREARKRKREKADLTVEASPLRRTSCMRMLLLLLLLSLGVGSVFWLGG